MAMLLVLKKFNRMYYENPFETRAIRIMAIRQPAQNEFQTREVLSQSSFANRKWLHFAIEHRGQSKPTSISVKPSVVYQSAWMQHYLIINAVCLSAGL